MTITEAFRPHHFFNAAFAPYLLVHLEIYSALANGGHPKPIIKPNGKEKKNSNQYMVEGYGEDHSY